MRADDSLEPVLSGLIKTASEILIKDGLPSGNFKFSKEGCLTFLKLTVSEATVTVRPDWVHLGRAGLGPLERISISASIPQILGTADGLPRNVTLSYSRKKPLTAENVAASIKKMVDKIRVTLAQRKDAINQQDRVVAEVQAEMDKRGVVCDIPLYQPTNSRVIEVGLACIEVSKDGSLSLRLDMGSDFSISEMVELCGEVQRLRKKWRKA